MNWKASLDRYLTQEPPDDTWWFESCAESIQCTDKQFDDHEKSIDKWMDFMFDKGSTPAYAANIISKILKLK